MTLAVPQAEDTLQDWIATHPMAVFDTVDSLLPVFEPSARDTFTRFAQSHGFTFEAIVYESALRVACRGRSAIGARPDDDPKRHFFDSRVPPEADTYVAGAHGQRIVELIRAADAPDRDELAVRWIDRLLARRPEDCERLALPDEGDSLLHLHDFLDWVLDELEARMQASVAGAEHDPALAGPSAEAGEALDILRAHDTPAQPVPPVPAFPSAGPATPEPVIAPLRLVQPTSYPMPVTALLLAGPPAAGPSDAVPYLVPADVPPIPPEPAPRLPRRISTAAAIYLILALGCLATAITAAPEAWDIIRNASLGTLLFLVLALVNWPAD